MSPSDDVLYVAEAPPDLAIVFNAEHASAFVCCPTARGVRAVALPPVVASGVANAAAWDRASRCVAIFAPPLRMSRGRMAIGCASERN